MIEAFDEVQWDVTTIKFFELRDLAIRKAAEGKAVLILGNVEPGYERTFTDGWLISGINDSASILSKEICVITNRNYSRAIDIKYENFLSVFMIRPALH